MKVGAKHRKNPKQKRKRAAEVVATVDGDVFFYGQAGALPLT